MIDLHRKYFKKIKKSLRYVFMYGFQRTLVKILYKTDNPLCLFILKVIYSSKSKHSSRIVFVGLGNHGFTLLAFFVTVIAKQKISVVIDPSTKSKTLASKVLNCKHYTDIESALQAGEFHGDIVYIASDHLSHTPHACIAADNFAKIYVEKPLFVNEEQMHDFKKVIYNSCNLYTGFNRPYSPLFKDFIDNLSDDFLVNIVVNGHFLSEDHWYRKEGQGSRVLGNLTHWIDLATRIFKIKNGSSNIDIVLSKGHLDDIVLILSSGKKKICLSFSANCEPSDGVEEFIFWNCEASTGKILNFREMEYVTKEGKMQRVKKLTKDVGHELAALAPINGTDQDAALAFISSALSLKVEEMYLNGESRSNFKLGI